MYVLLPLTKRRWSRGLNATTSCLSDDDDDDTSRIRFRHISRPPPLQPPPPPTTTPINTSLSVITSNTTTTTTHLYHQTSPSRAVIDHHYNDGMAHISPPPSDNDDVLDAYREGRLDEETNISLLYDVGFTRQLLLFHDSRMSTPLHVTTATPHPLPLLHLPPPPPPVVPLLLAPPSFCSPSSTSLTRLRSCVQRVSSTLASPWFAASFLQSD